MDRRIGASSAVMRALLLHIERSQLRWFIWLGCLLGGGPGSEPELTGGIIYPLWPGTASGSPRRSGRGGLGLTRRPVSSETRPRISG